MGLIRYDIPQIIVEISDLTLDSTIIKRKARFDSLHYQQLDQPNYDGKQIVVISLTILHYTQLSDGSYGELINNSRGIQSYQTQLIADNSTLVDATTGQIIGPSSLLDDPNNLLDAYTDENGVQHDAGILFGKDYMYESEFFRRIADQLPVVVDDLIKLHIVTANTDNRL
jgi:hypothetical protein